MHKGHALLKDVAIFLQTTCVSQVGWIMALGLKSQVFSEFNLQGFKSHYAEQSSLLQSSSVPPSQHPGLSGRGGQH